MDIKLGRRLFLRLQSQPLTERAIYYGFACWSVAITAISFILLQTVGKRPTLLAYDAYVYAQLSSSFKLFQPDTWYDPLRTYGYPLYLLLVRALAESLGLGQRWPSVLTLLEFGLHTTMSAAAAAAFVYLGRARFSPRACLFGAAVCFTLVQLDLALLGATQDVLTYHLNAVLLAWFFWSFTTQARGRIFWRGLALALAVVVRPFNFTWACGLAGLVVAAVLLNHLARGRTWLTPWRASAAALSWSNCVWFCVPVVVLVGWQFCLIYRTEQRFGVAGKDAAAALRLHDSLRGTTLRYDSYLGGDPAIKPSVYYTSERNQQLVQRCAERGESLAECVWRHPRNWPYVLETLAIKATGMFQNFEWSTYRGQLDNAPNALFWQGALLFFLFLYTMFDYFRRLIAHNRLPLYEHVIALGCGAYVLLYAIFTAPQTDYIFPVHQPMIVLGLYRLSDRLSLRRREWILMGGVMAVAVLLYLYSYIVLLRALSFGRIKG